MAGFEFCQECKDDYGYINSHKTGWYALQNSIGLCDSCWEGHEKFLGDMQRDRAYRSHIARQLAGYACDVTSGCPHHPPSYEYYTPPRNDAERWQYGELVRRATEQVYRDSSSSITSLEMIGSHHLSLVRFCDGCYGKALDGLDQNIQLRPCEECFSKREKFIDKFHHHQSSFFEPWEHYVQGNIRPLLWDQIGKFIDIRSGTDDEYDGVLHFVRRQLVGGGRPEPLDVASIAFAGLAAPALIVGVAAVVYSRRQWRLAQNAQSEGQALSILNQIASGITSGRVTITAQDVENVSTDSFITAQTHIDGTSQTEVDGTAATNASVEHSFAHHGD